ncbi:acyl-homoserine-lactone synthase [Yersinia bercovieri]|uniref:acyl-homoserine-lactone synthase n=1 Tax=Yersinia bercovieri TaxID=634 RepID=UPI00119CB2F5|nr:acyl-homoserine-lactone synthase [Yersinia bercovieri]
MEIFDVSYSSLSTMRARELFLLRKNVFKDRLNWNVNCENGMEFDEYDSIHTTYLFGVHDDQVICSLRFIGIKHPNMITGVFKSYFNKIELPDGNYLEASRLFIAKNRTKTLQLQHYPISSMLFLSMINYTRHQGYEGIYAIISHPMLAIFKRSGWLISVVEQGLSEENKIIYVVYMPVDEHNQQILMHKISKTLLIENDKLNTWPLSLDIRSNQV